MNTWGDRHKRWRVHRMHGKLVCGTQEIKPCGECIRFGLKEITSANGTYCWQIINY